LEDCIINTSDHLPITITITASITECEASSKQCRIAWNKLTEHEIVEKYTTPLEQCINTEFEKLLQNPDCIVRETQAIDDYTDRLTQCMARSSDALRKDSKSIHTKPYWNASLTALSKHTKSTWHAWCDKGRPRGNDELFLQYKEAKKQFRQERKQTEREYEHRNIQKLCDAQDMDQSYFWFLVNRHKPRTSRASHPLKLGPTETITDPNQIRQAWANHFQKLYTASEKPAFNRIWKDKSRNRFATNESRII
jgi:hypothetical protein